MKFGELVQFLFFLSIFSFSYIFSPLFYIFLFQEEIRQARDPMQSLAGWFKGSVPDNEPPASVLAEWNSYAGKPSASVSDRLLASAEEGGGSSTFGRALSHTFSSVSAAAAAATASVNTSVQK